MTGALPRLGMAGRPSSRSLLPGSRVRSPCGLGRAVCWPVKPGAVADFHILTEDEPRAGTFDGFDAYRVAFKIGVHPVGLDDVQCHVIAASAFHAHAPVMPGSRC